MFWKNIYLYREWEDERKEEFAEVISLLLLSTIKKKPELLNLKTLLPHK